MNMRYALGAVILVVAGYFAFQQLRPAPPPPPPPAPPPAIQLEPVPVVNPQEQQKIVRATDDQDPNVRWEAMVFLDKLKAPQALPILFDKLHKDSETDLRIKIVSLLSDRHGADVSRNLVDALRDSEPTVRVAVLQALDKVGDFSTASAITEALKDQDETVRVQALKTLNSLQDKKAAEIAAEQQRQEELRRQAEEAKRR